MNGALGLLFNATVDIAGVPVSALVDPGLSAIIMSIQDTEPRQQFHKKLCRSPITTFPHDMVNLEYSQQAAGESQH